MAVCIACATELAPDDPPRYDVLSEGYDPDDPTDLRGPYCAADFAQTVTGSTPPSPPPVAPEPVDEPPAAWDTDSHE